MYVVCIKYLSMSGYRIWMSVGRPTFPVSGTESVWLVPGTASETD
jgi:hypothetical protein